MSSENKSVFKEAVYVLLYWETDILTNREFKVAIFMQLNFGKGCSCTYE